MIYDHPNKGGIKPDSHWTGRREEAQAWDTAALRMKRRLERACIVHRLGKHSLHTKKVDKQKNPGAVCHYHAVSKCIEIVNEAGAVVLTHTLPWNAEHQDWEVIDRRFMVCTLIMAREGCDTDTAQALFDANEQRAMEHRRYSPGRPKGSKNRVNTESLARMEERAKSRNPEYRKHVRSIELQVRPWLKRKRDNSPGSEVSQMESATDVEAAV